MAEGVLVCGPLEHISSLLWMVTYKSLLFVHTISMSRPFLHEKDRCGEDLACSSLRHGIVTASHCVGLHASMDHLVYLTQTNKHTHTHVLCFNEKFITIKTMDTQVNSSFHENMPPSVNSVNSAFFTEFIEGSMFMNKL